ncbi:hypothetical protein [Mesorhizobium sp.]|uniref:hypothetical protein n=1 Tax=Mesorhizobium sp. TaxID=1871066 RepID=UPI000FE77D1F|nr:hypothetical protein [Mesorhizobium sp.]RWP01145.1 MAG: hypothetical protein EOQ97_26670 [Mesorhizobium sp.]
MLRVLVYIFFAPLLLSTTPALAHSPMLPYQLGPFEKEKVMIGQPPRDAFISRVSSAVATAILRRVFLGNVNNVYDDGGTVYRSVEYNRKMQKDYSGSGDKSAHIFELAVDVGIATMNEGRFGEWLDILDANGLYIPNPWDPIHVEPKPGTDLYDTRGATFGDTPRQTYADQIRSLIAVRAKIESQGNADFLAYSGAFPAELPAGDEADLRKVIALFHESFSRQIIHEGRSIEELGRLRKAFGKMYESVQRDFSSSAGTSGLVGPVMTRSSVFGLTMNPFNMFSAEPPVPGKSTPSRRYDIRDLYILSAERYSVRVIRSTTLRVIEERRIQAEIEKIAERIRLSANEAARRAAHSDGLRLDGDSFERSYHGYDDYLGWRENGGGGYADDDQVYEFEPEYVSGHRSAE